MRKLLLLLALGCAGPDRPTTDDLRAELRGMDASSVTKRLGRPSAATQSEWWYDRRVAVPPGSSRPVGACVHWSNGAVADVTFFRSME